LLHFFLPIIGDDTYFMAAAQTPDLLNWLWHRYNGWSSRVIIESFLLIIANSFLLWKIINIILILLLYYLFVKIFADQHDNTTCWVCAFCILLYPFWHMNSAGYMTTTVNYLWPLVFAFISGYGMKKSFLNKKIQIWEYPIYISSLLYASNIEQMNVLLLLIITLLFLYSSFQKRIDYYLLLQLLIVAAMLIFILTCPGNASRYSSEVLSWYPDYGMLGFIEKLQLGYSSTLAHFIVSPNIVFTTFCILLYISIHIQYSNILYKVIAAIPLLVYILFVIFNIFYSYDSNIIYWIRKIQGVKNATSIINYAPLLILGLCSILCIFVSIYLCFKNDRLKALFCIMFIIFGLSSRIVMGFSPTIWASSYRTFIFIYFVFIVCIALFYQRLKIITFKHESVLFMTLCTLGIVSYLCSFFVLFHGNFRSI